MRQRLLLAALLAPLAAPAAGQLAAPDQLWSQDSPGVLETAEMADAFGHVAVGDFDGDGFQDLSVGVPFEDLVTTAGTLADAGGVHILYGSLAGLNSSGDQFFTEDSLGGVESSEAGDYFGNALAAGDFDSDGFDDLAIAAEHESVGTAAAAGAVFVLYGTPTGLLTGSHQIWHQDSPNVAGTAEENDQFGFALAVGRFDGDIFDDLAIGVNFEAIGAISQAGAVNVLYGSASGLTDTGKFPIEFTDTHDLAIDYLIREAIVCQKQDIADLQGCVDELRLAPAAQSLAAEALGMAKGHLESLEELGAKAGPSTIVRNGAPAFDND